MPAYSEREQQRARLRQEEHNEDSSSEDRGPTLIKWLPLVLILGLALGLAGFFVASWMAGANGSRASCIGFNECPPYPEPYKFGEWPQTYTFAGSFPKGFIWGLGTASYQIEGAYREDGRGASIWDTFAGADTVGMPGANCSYCCKKAPCPINSAMASRGATGNVACDHYHVWKDDIALMKSMGLKHYRFSLAWPRLIPTGFIEDGVNQKAVAFYNNLINGLLKEGITPYVTLYHWDLPQGLLDPPNKLGWWSRDNATGKPDGWILPEWKAYVDLCFKTFGDRVKMWITFNEAWTFTFLASGFGKAPSIAALGNMTVDPWIAGHTVLNAHAAAVDIYRKKYAAQAGKIGITNNCDWREPMTDTPEDAGAAERTLLFWLGWFSDPIFGETGDYPEEMKRLYGAALPEFTAEEKQLLKGSADFYGLNHYGTGFVANADESGADRSYGKVYEVDGNLALPEAQSVWLYGAGWGLRKLLNWVDRRYKHPDILLTEGGWSIRASNDEEGSRDFDRVGYYANYTSEVLKAITEDNVRVLGYFAWSLMDNFEWEQGYVQRFGTTYTDYAYGPDPRASSLGNYSVRQPTELVQVRRRKDSSCWLEAVWTGNKLVDPKGKAFRGCVDSLVFNGTYTDAAHPGCERTILVGANGRSGNISSRAVGGAVLCDIAADKAFGSNRANFSGGTVMVRFERPLTPPERMTGYWNSGTNSINWGDGSTWRKVTS